MERLSPISIGTSLSHDDSINRDLRIMDINLYILSVRFRFQFQYFRVFLGYLFLLVSFFESKLEYRNK